MTTRITRISIVIIALVVLLAFALMVYAASADQPDIGFQVFLPVAANQYASVSYPTDGWVVASVWLGPDGTTYFKMTNNGWTVDAMCTQPTVTPPPVGTVCTLNGDAFTCPGWQASIIIKVITTPTPTPTQTNTPTQTPIFTETPTPTPTSCYNPCPAMKLRVEYPVGTLQYNVQFAEAPTMPMGALFRMYTGNETKLTFPVNGTVSAKIYCQNGTYNITSGCADGSCKFSCATYGYSLTRCDVKVTQHINTPCGVVVCQAGFPVIDPEDDPLAERP